MPTPLDQRKLDALRAEADRFIAELDEEAYLHFAGLKETYDLVPIYERHAELTKLDTALDIGASVNGGRNVRELWRFACEGYLGNFVSEEEEKIAEAETKTVQVGDEAIPYRDLRPRIANADDRDVRKRLELARNEATEEHNGLYGRKHQVVHRETERLGSPNYTELYRRFDYPLDDLAGQCRDFLQSTERLWEDAGDRFFRSRIGVGLGEIERWDVTRVWRGVTWDSAFPKERMLPALEATLADLGVDLHAQRNVELDLEDRPNKSPRAFCVPIEVPERVDPRDQAAGRPRRLARALPRGRAHRALRAHVAVAHGRGAPARRQRGHRGLGDAARAPDHRSGVARPAARLPAPARVRGRGRDATAVAAAPLLREAPVRDRVPRGGRRRRRCARATSSCSATR